VVGGDERPRTGAPLRPLAQLTRGHAGSPGVAFGSRSTAAARARNLATARPDGCPAPGERRPAGARQQSAEVHGVERPDARLTAQPHAQGRTRRGRVRQSGNARGTGGRCTSENSCSCQADSCPLLPMVKPITNASSAGRTPRPSRTWMQS
jgi:hypothetical protein